MGFYSRPFVLCDFSISKCPTVRRAAHIRKVGQRGLMFFLHACATRIVNGLIGLPAPSRLHSGIPRLPSLHFIPFRAALRCAPLADCGEWGIPLVNTD